MLCYSDGTDNKWFVLLAHAIAATTFASHSVNIWTFLHISTRQCLGSPCSQNGCTAAILVILQERVYYCQIHDIDHLKERLIHEWCHFDQHIIDISSRPEVTASA